MTIDVKTRMDLISRILGCNNDFELAQCLNIHQPQVSRWRNSGFHASTAALIDALLEVIANLRGKLPGA